MPNVIRHSRRAAWSGIAIVTTIAALMLVVPVRAQEQPPNVVGFNVDDAQARLEEAGFESELVPPDPPIARELVVVLGQEDFPEDRFVRLSIGTEVPRVVGSSGADVEAILAQYGLAVVPDGDLSEGWEVVRQSPEPGTPVGFEETVRVGLEFVGDEGGDGGVVDGGGDGSPLPWIVLVLVVGGGAIVLRRWRKPRVRSQEPPTEDQPEEEPDEREPQRVSVQPVPRPPSIHVDLPPDGSSGHAVRVEIVVGPAAHHVEEYEG